MAYHNTGYARNMTLIVTNGDQTRSFDIRAQFTNPDNGIQFGQVSETEFARLTNAEYQNRLQAFVRYVYSQVDGLETDCPNLAAGAQVFDPVSCPLPKPSSEEEQHDE